MREGSEGGASTAHQRASQLIRLISYSMENASRENSESNDCVGALDNVSASMQQKANSGGKGSGAGASPLGPLHRLSQPVSAAN